MFLQLLKIVGLIQTWLWRSSFHSSDVLFWSVSMHCRINVNSLYDILIILRKLREYSFFLVSYVEERQWWPIQCPNKGRRKKAKG